MAFTVTPGTSLVWVSIALACNVNDSLHARCVGRIWGQCFYCASRLATISTCHEHVDVSTTEPSWLLRRRFGIDCYWQNSSNCDRQRYKENLKTRLFCLPDLW